ncbi:hypothetical protein ACGFYY_41255 [Streptomyces sp. NPDC048331]|uniref:hypothetical protein n=1 Tax=Streptomyces sp. NPDC048331 TaxID=3365534 RepID=UPI003723603C
MPDHHNVLDPGWQRAWARFAHVITPLRERGLLCDVQFGLDDWLVYASPPGHDAVLIIGHDDGWLVTHQAPAQDWASMTVVYDSTASSGPSDFDDIDPLLASVDVLLAQLARTAPAPVAGGRHTAEVPTPPPAGRGTRSR